MLELNLNLKILIILLIISDILIILLGFGVYFFPPTTLLLNNVENIPLLYGWLLGFFFPYEEPTFVVANISICYLLYYELLFWGILNQFAGIYFLIKRKIHNLNQFAGLSLQLPIYLANPHILHTAIYIYILWFGSQSPFIAVLDLNTFIPFIINLIAFLFIIHELKKQNLKKKVPKMYRQLDDI
ncbi:MAG: hypothetical protein GF329_06225 [Candidatus Lokiarchaeota archaeon]|nr:hypothetical protein [Candidatus Lokiarchaeota archaeon]